MKKFNISRHSYASDSDDDGITAHEIEKILNDSNKTHRTSMSEGLWKVEEEVGNMEDVIKLSRVEVESRVNRVRWAELLIEQLPDTHEGRNSWLTSYGAGMKSEKLRERRNAPDVRGGRPRLVWNPELSKAVRKGE